MLFCMKQRVKLLKRIDVKLESTTLRCVIQANNLAVKELNLVKIQIATKELIRCS